MPEARGNNCLVYVFQLRIFLCDFYTYHWLRIISIKKNYPGQLQLIVEIAVAQPQGALFFWFCSGRHHSPWVQCNWFVPGLCNVALLQEGRAVTVDFSCRYMCSVWSVHPYIYKNQLKVRLKKWLPFNRSLEPVFGKHNHFFPLLKVFWDLTAPQMK